MQINKNIIMATIGFLGNTALVDKKLKKQIKKLTIAQLLAQGSYKEAVSWAVFENDEEKKQTILEYFKERNYTGSFEYLSIEFGIHASVFDKIQKIKII